MTSCEASPSTDGTIVKVRVDTVALPDGSQVEREVVEHAGSLAVVAIDDQQRVLLIRQYRHPAGQHLWELPAGLCDQPGEQPLDTGRRELAEETGPGSSVVEHAGRSAPLTGMSTEVCRVYQAAAGSTAAAPRGIPGPRPPACGRPG
jgi:8-oxo-dGDP phosphatase